MEKEANWICPNVDHMTTLGKTHGGKDHFIWPTSDKKPFSIWYQFFHTGQEKALLICKTVKLQTGMKDRIK